MNFGKVGSTSHGGGGIAKDYGPNYTGPALPPGYSYEWRATVIDKSRSKVRLWIRDVDDGSSDVNGYAVGCGTHKAFFVRRIGQTKLRMGCKVKVNAYFGFEPVEE